MNCVEFSDAALVLLGHGTTLNAESSAPVYQHARELRRRGCFGEVREAFWKQEPRVKEVLSGLDAPRVFIVPCFISEGYFSEVVIPRELGFCGERRDSAPGTSSPRPSPPGEERGKEGARGGSSEAKFADKAGQGRFARVRREGGQTWFYTQPVGTHESMTAVLLARAHEVVEKHPGSSAPEPAETTLFIAGHGTGANENSRKTVEQQAERIRALELYAGVEAVFLEEDPRIGDCYRLARTRNLVVVPFFISDGLHVREDIPELLGESKEAVRERLGKGEPTWPNPVERNGKRVWYAPSVGSDPLLAEVILERAKEAWALSRLKAEG